MRGVAASTDAGDLGAPLFQILERENVQGPADALALHRRVDRVQSDLAGPSLLVDHGEDEAGNDAVKLGDEDFAFVARGRNAADGLRVLPPPVVILELEDP